MAFPLRAQHRGMLRKVFKCFSGLNLWGCLARGPLYFKFNLLFLRGREMADERAKEEGGEIKPEGGGVTCYCMCCTKLILNCDGRRRLSEAVKVPMNHTALTLFSLSLHVLVSLFIFLFLPVGFSLSAWLSLPLFLCLFLRCHMYLSQSTISDMGCAGEERSAFVSVFAFIRSSRHMLFYLPPRVSVSRPGPGLLLGLVAAVEVL